MARRHRRAIFAILLQVALGIFSVLATVIVHIHASLVRCVECSQSFVINTKGSRHVTVSNFDDDTVCIVDGTCSDMLFAIFAVIL